MLTSRGAGCSSQDADAGADARRLAHELVADAEFDSMVFEGVTGVTRAIHMCRGNAPGGMRAATGGYEAISKEVFPRLRPDQLVARIDEAARYVLLERLAVSPQCGFAPGVIGAMTADEQEAKLRLIGDVARRVWG